MSAFKWIAIGLGLVAAGALGIVGFKMLKPGPERGTETLPDGRIVAWELVPADGLWIVRVGVGADPMAQIGSAPTIEMAKLTLESKLRDLRSGHPKVGTVSGGTVYRTWSA